MNFRVFAKLILLSAMVIAAYIPGQALAAMLSDATFEERVVINYNNPVDGYHFVEANGTSDRVGENLHITSSSSGDYGGGWAGSMASAGSPPVANGDVSIAAGTYDGAVGGSSLTKISYEFAVERIDGGAGVGAIPVTIAVSGSVYINESNSTNNSATAYVSTSATPTAWRANVNDVDGEGSASFNEQVNANLIPGWTYTVYMETLVQGNVYTANSSFIGTAMVDPIIEFAEGFEEADQYQIFLSPGITAVPAPSSFMLLVSALITLCWRRRS